MLFTEFLKERKKAEDQQETIAQLKSDATKQEAASIELKATVAQRQMTDSGFRRNQRQFLEMLLVRTY